MSGCRIAVCCGDPSGLGPELIERCLRERDYGDVTFRLFGPGPWLDAVDSGASSHAVERVALSERSFAAGSPCAEGARLAVTAMEAAAQACLDGECVAVVTGPISKARCAAEGFAFPGQTEFFADRWGGQASMAFVGDRLRVSLATWHIPLASVSSHLTKDVFARAVRAAFALGRITGLDQPRVLVCGLNPHAGEGGLLGSEEIERLNPWLLQLAAELPGLPSACVPGDTVFARLLRGEADVGVALYHDQGLAPFKAVDFDTGVNVTLGLPFLRVSPDHGTGYEIAGRGLASAESMDRAIRLAAAGA